jgi:hypothetical protein
MKAAREYKTLAATLMDLFVFLSAFIFILNKFLHVYQTNK